MKQIYLGVFLLVLVTSCSTGAVTTMTKEQEQVMDSLTKLFYTNISIGTSKDFMKLSKPYDLEVILEGRTIQTDSLEYIAKITAEKLYPTLQKKEKYGNLIVRFNTQTQGTIGVGTEASYTFDLSKMK